ncbi:MULTISPECIES: hypothetical protein [unclassified Bradyrhizobium]|uniref:hypothetical protein n=1 Tax=unclassified Bradyrhizobium TaxID=2631580 RepID=UPI0028F102C8|nr:MULTISPECIES: hypothetical protein [unclassified Bradyrhizobium]
MSYTSESKLPNTVKLSQLQEVIELLGYKKIGNPLDIPNQVSSYFWLDENEYKSWTGVELQIYRKGGEITVDTRSRVSRSYWDLRHQNKTLKTIRDLFGGHFTTDAGRNRYYHPDEPPPSLLSSGCYLARWRFHNALIKARVYLMTRKLEGDLAKETPSGFLFMDEMNPRLLSNNLLIPFVLAIWEEYFRATFAAALKYSNRREPVLKKARLSHDQLEKIAIEDQPLERTVAECFSFQRPSSISETFKLLDSRIDLGGAMRKPYKRRKVSLYDSIESLVEGRNAFVHEGRINVKLYDRELQVILDDIVEAVDRAYATIGNHYRFSPIHDY